MTEAVFKCSVTAFYSVIFACFLPLFWVYSSLILADILAMAFGFGAIYAFTAMKHKSLLLFALGMGMIRESSLAFFVPLILYGTAVSSHRKSLLYLTPGLIVFFLHFFIFFLKTGRWIAHPYMLGILSHNPNPDFFNFSIILNNIRYKFLPLVWDTFPLVFFLLVGIAIMGYIVIFCLNKKKDFSPSKEILIPLCMCVLWFSFWIIYPDQLERNYFPLLMFFIPLGIYFIVKVMPYFHIFLIGICSFLVIQTVYMESYINESDNYLQSDILNAKAFISYFDKTHGDKIRNSKKIVFFTWPESMFLTFPEYEYVKVSIDTYSDCQLSKKTNIEKYGMVIFRNISDVCVPFYDKITTSNSFTQVETPFKTYKVFIHKDLLSTKHDTLVFKNNF